MDRFGNLQCENFCIKYLKSKIIEDEIKKNFNMKELQTKLETSDVYSGEYEGGFKVWESSLDLCRYLATSDSKQVINEKTTLELGCGAGLPGIVSLLQNANKICFQDLNQEVIDLWTKPNVELNGKDLLEKCQFVSGDWSLLQETLGDQKFDLILSSETIYNPNYYGKLHECLKNMLHSKNGLVLIAAKTYYFGCGGSIPSFLSFVDKENYFKHDIVWTSQTANVPRQIFSLEPI